MNEMTCSSVASVLPDLIQMTGISRVFCTDRMETHALAELDLSIRWGEFVSISGPSGCGKSTLLSIMGLLDAPTSGSYLLEGVPVGQYDSEEQTRIRNRDIGFIFQSFNLIGDLSVFENVELPLEYRGLRRSERRQRVEQVLERVQLYHRRNHLPGQLSGGQQQRVAVARALAGEPKILLADEPTGNLDSGNGGKVMELLQRLHAEGSTICMVSHDERFQSMASRVVHLWDGRIVPSLQPVFG
jgi:putative ABC transport system ATP-binding protein